MSRAMSLEILSQRKRERQKPNHKQIAINKEKTMSAKNYLVVL